MNAAQRGEIVLATSIALLEEFSEVIVRPHILRKFPLVAEHADIILDFLRTHALLNASVPPATIIQDDPDDDYVLACAQEAQADYIISGDQHLLALGRYIDIPILSPRIFIEEILSQQ